MHTIDHPPAAAAPQAVSQAVSQAASQAAFLVGQDGDGHWLAVETHGLGGGIFVSRDEAVLYARHACRQPDAVRFADGPIRLFTR